MGAEDNGPNAGELAQRMEELATGSRSWSKRTGCYVKRSIAVPLTAS